MGFFLDQSPSNQSACTDPRAHHDGAGKKKENHSRHFYGVVQTKVTLNHRISAQTSLLKRTPSAIIVYK